jgi:hypothetical protein
MAMLAIAPRKGQLETSEKLLRFAAAAAARRRITSAAGGERQMKKRTNFCGGEGENKWENTNGDTNDFLPPRSCTSPD